MVFPYGAAKKYRKGFEKDEEGGRKFWWDPPTQAGQVPFLPPDFAPRERMILLEGETDTMAAWQAMPPELREKVGIVGLSGLNAWKTRYVEELFAESKRVFVVLDNDDPYAAPDAAKAGEKAWSQIRGDLGRIARRVTLPQGTNDVCEFFQTYDWAAFESILKAAAQPVRHYPRLDLTKPVPPTDWVIEGLIEAGVVTVLAGDSGVGKSFITSALGIAVASDEPKFLGLPVKKHGRVIIVDEENAPDLVLQRLNALGLKPEHKERIEYISMAGVNLYAEPTLLLEEALDIEPTVIVLDSQSAVGLGAEENSNDDMTRLFKNGFRPLARETGAAVVILHHTPKDAKGIPRGAGAIKAQADQVLSVVAAEAGGVTTGRLNVFPSKARRQMASLTIEIVGEMEHDGWVKVQTPPEAF